MSGTTFVTLTFYARSKARAVNSVLAGDVDGALPESYGLSPAALAALLDDWRIGRPHGVADSGGGLEGFRDLARSAKSGGGLLALKLSALFSFCGGPLFFADLLDVKQRSAWHFAVPFAPIALLLFGALALRGEEADTLGRISIEGGLFGAAALTAMNAYATLQLVAGAPRADGNLMAFGIAVGFCTAVIYVVTALRFLRDQPP